MCFYDGGGTAGSGGCAVHTSGSAVDLHLLRSKTSPCTTPHTRTQVCPQATVPGRIHLSHTHTGVCRALKHVHCVRGGVEISFKLKGIMQ